MVLDKAVIVHVPVDRSPATNGRSLLLYHLIVILSDDIGIVSDSIIVHYIILYREWSMGIPGS